MVVHCKGGFGGGVGRVDEATRRGQQRTDVCVSMSCGIFQEAGFARRQQQHM